MSALVTLIICFINTNINSYSFDPMTAYCATALHTATDPTAPPSKPLVGPTKRF